MTKTELNNLQYQVIGAAIEVHRELGPGLLENIYQKCLRYELVSSGHQVQCEFYVPVYYKGLNMHTDLKCDLLVNDCIVVELKAVEIMHPVFDAQLMTYMKLLEKPKGLLINFNCVNIAGGGYKSFVNEFFRALPD